MGQSTRLSQDVREECYIDGRHNLFSQCLLFIALRSVFLSLIVRCQFALGCVCLCVPINNLAVIAHLDVVDDLIPL